MKRQKKIWILLGVLAVFSLTTVIVMNLEKKKEDIKNTDQVILSVTADDVKSLSWEYDDTSLSFKKNDTWTWEDDDAFPVDEEKINSLLSNFSELGADFIIEDVEDYSQYGLSKPACTITFATDDKEYEVKLGDMSTMDSQRYVSIGDGNVYLVDTDPYDSFAIEIKDLIKSDELPVLSDVQSIQFTGSANYTLTKDENSKESYCSDDKYFTEQSGELVPLDTDAVEDYCGAIETLDLSEYASYNVTDEELKDWGLDSPELTVALNYVITDSNEDESEESTTLQIGRNQEELAKKLKAEKKGKDYDGTVTAYLRFDGSNIVYQITEDEYDNLIAGSYNDLRHKDVMTADFNTIDTIDVTLDGESYTLTCRESEESADSDDLDSLEYSLYYNDEEYSASDFKTALQALYVSEFNDKTAEKKQEISMTFHLNDKDKTSIQVDIYRNDNETCLVVLDGKTLGYISRTSVVELVESINEIVL